MVLKTEIYKTSHRNITRKVPKGTIFSPLLFLLCMNDLHKASMNTTLIMFAYDTILAKASKIYLKQWLQNLLKFLIG